MHAEEDELQVLTQCRKPWWSPACRWKGKGWKLRLHTALSLFLALIAWVASMKFVLQSIFMSSDESTGPIFSLDFWTNLLESKAYTSFHFHWQLQTEANFWNSGRRLKFHFHFSEIIQMSSVDTEPSQQSELFSILLWRGSWFWLFKSQNQLPFHTIN